MITRFSGRLCGASAFVLAITLGAPANAEDAAKKADASQAEKTEDARDDEDTILVMGERDIPLDAETQTGSRLGLDIREVPATLDVLTQERFIERGLRTTDEALNSAPGVNGASLSMRGFGGNNISFNYDGIHQGSSSMITRNYDSFAFEQIEVLKGPASVLFGEGALGGAVNLVPKRPMLDKIAVQGIAQYGSRDAYRVAGDVNIPLSDQIAVRAVVSHSGAERKVDRMDSKMLTANLGLTLQPSDDLTIFLAAEYFYNKNYANYGGTPLVSAAVAREPTDLITTATGFVLDRALSRLNLQYENGVQSSKSKWLRSQINWEINDVWTLRNDFSYNKSDRLWHHAESFSFNATTRMASRTPVYILNDFDFWNERISLSSDSKIGGMRNRFMIGAEYSRNDHVSYRRFGRAVANVDPYNMVPGLFPEFNLTNFPTNTTYEDSEAKVTNKAIFAEDALNLTDKWLLVVGGRYEELKLDRLITSKHTGVVSKFGTTYHPSSYRVGTVYDVTPKTQLYAQYTVASAPVATLLLMSSANTNFKLTDGKSAEFGLKSTFWNNRVNATLSAYWIEQNNILTRPDPSSPNTDPIQGGTQSSRGVEVAVAAALTRDLRADANFSYVKARYDDLIEVVSGARVSRAGNRPSGVPKTIVNLFANYQPGQGPVKLTGGMRYSGSTFGDTANTIRIKGYTVFDASIGYTFPIGDVTVRGRNLTNRFYVELGGSNTATIAAPRSVDLTFRTKF